VPEESGKTADRDANERYDVPMGQSNQEPPDRERKNPSSLLDLAAEDGSPDPTLDLLG